MNAIEDRLTSALAARAEQVHPDDLASVEMPRDARWKRPVGLMLVAAACAALISVPFLVNDGDDEGAPADNPGQVDGKDAPEFYPTADGRIAVGETWQVGQDGDTKRGGIDSVTLKGKREYDGLTSHPVLEVRVGQIADQLRLNGLGTFRVVTTLLSGDTPMVAVERDIPGRPLSYQVYEFTTLRGEAFVGFRELREASEDGVRQGKQPKMGDGIESTFNWVSEEGVLYTRRTREADGVAKGEVWRWDVDGASMTTESLGTWCFDVEQPQDYERC